MLAKMARSAPSAAVRSVNGDDSRPRRQPGLPKRGENAKIRGGSEFIRRIPDNNGLHYPSGLLRDGGSHHRGAPALHRVRAHVGGRDDETGELHSEDDNGGWLGRVVSARLPGGDSLGAIALR
jgi:hypothetical protein